MATSEEAAAVRIAHGVKCPVEGCDGKWKTETVGWTEELTGSIVICYQVTCTVGGDDHVRSWVHANKKELEIR